MKNLFTFKSKLEKGFTLIELLVVIAIISLLSSVVLASLRDAREKAKVSAFKQQVDQFILGLEIFKSDNKLFPRYTDGGYEIISYADTQNFTEGESFFSSYFEQYIQKFPIPPAGVVSGVTFYYQAIGEVDSETIGCGDNAKIAVVVNMNGQSNGYYDSAFSSWERINSNQDFCYPIYGELDQGVFPIVI